MSAEIEYDATSDAAYIRLGDRPPGIVDHSIECHLRADLPPVVFDMSADGSVLGIEFIRASAVLAPGLLRGAS